VLVDAAIGRIVAAPAPDADLMVVSPVGMEVAWRVDLRAVAEANWSAHPRPPGGDPADPHPPRHRPGRAADRGGHPQRTRAQRPDRPRAARRLPRGDGVRQRLRAGRARERGSERGDGRSVGQVLARPPERYPRLLEAATTAATSAPAAEFHAGLDILIAGLDRTEEPWCCIPARLTAACPGLAHVPVGGLVGALCAALEERLARDPSRSTSS
jgi:hypothetical protein